MENIINGRPASQAHFKYQVEVATKRNFSNQIYTLCGGGAIADDIVMSAASCVIDIIREERNESVLVIAGVDDLTNKGIEVFVYVIYLARYKRRAMQNDIALLKLIDGLGVGKNPRIALLALPSQPIVGFTGIVAGFGVNKADHQINPTKGYLEIVNGTTDFTLRYGKVEICTNKKCIEDHIEVDIANQICGIMIPFEEGETAGVCSGDGGSPLVIDDAVVGIVSTMQHSCNDTAKGAVYTRVTYFKQFIQKILQGIPPLYTEIYYNRPHVLEDLDSVF